VAVIDCQQPGAGGSSTKALTGTESMCRSLSCFAEIDIADDEIDHAVTWDLVRLMSVVMEVAL
jgi:hypothetical protein